MSLFQREGHGFKSRIPLHMHTVYILQSETTNRYYIGSTSDIVRRLKEHNNSCTRSLKGKGPYKVIYTEEHPERLTAYRRELQIKKYKPIVQRVECPAKGGEVTGSNPVSRSIAKYCYCI